MKNRKATLSIIFFTVFIDLMGFGILIPILPTFADKVLHVSEFQIGMIVAIYSLVQFLFNPVLGTISDQIGRRPVIILTLFITSVSYLMFSFADTFLILFLSRFIAGFGGSNIGVAQAYIADITEKSERSKGMGLIGAAFGLGFMFGPLLGGIISEFGYKYAGFLSSAFSLMAMIFAIFFLPESLTKQNISPKGKLRVINFKKVKSVLKMPIVGLLIILFFIIIFSVANIYGTFALLGYKVYNFTDKQNGLLFGITGLVGALVQGYVIRKISKKFSDRNLLLFGSFTMMIGLGFLPYGINFIGAALIVTILSVGTGILQPTVLSMISKFSPNDQQGEILGINQSLSAFGRVLGPLWGGFAFDYIGYEFPFLTGAFFTLITFTIAYIYLKNI